MPPLKQLFTDLEALYQRVDKEISLLGAQCSQDGECCQFDRSDLSLFLTELEASYLVHQEGSPPKPLKEERCPYQDGSNCRARAGRPLGCRTYFCDPSLSRAISALYERFHAEIMALHERYRIPYLYRKLSDHTVFTTASLRSERSNKTAS